MEKERVKNQIQYNLKGNNKLEQIARTLRRKVFKPNNNENQNFKHRSLSHHNKVILAIVQSKTLNKTTMFSSLVILYSMGTGLTKHNDIQSSLHN